MAFIDIDIENIVSFCLEAQLELIGAIFFFGSYIIGKKYNLFGKKHQKSKSTKIQHKQTLLQRGKTGSPNRSRTTAGSPAAAKAKLEFDIQSIDPAVFNDPPRLVAQLVQMCAAKVPEVIALYTSSKQVGFQLSDVSAEDCQKLVFNLVPATIRDGTIEDTLQVLADLRESGHDVSPRATADMFASIVKLCTCKQLFAECLAVYDVMTEYLHFPSADKCIWSCLLVCATESKAYHRCADFFDKLKAHSAPSAKDYTNMLRVAAAQGDFDVSLSLMQQMRDQGVNIDNLQCNTTVAAFINNGKLDQACALLESVESVPGAVDVVAYNTIMKGFAKVGDITKCLALFDRMKAKNIESSQVTYGIVLDICMSENRMDQAMQVFNNLTEAGCPMNTILYTTLIKGFARAGELEKAMNMYEQMKEHSVSPDLITFGVLVKANCDNDKLQDALQLLAEMISLGLKPDEVVFNSLMAGCGRNGNAAVAKQLYKDMVKSGVRPSNATFSVLIRVHHQSKLLEEAVTLLKDEPSKHNVDPEPRLFLQLISSCIRERQGKRAVEVYEMLAKRSLTPASMHNTIISTCLRLNMYDTAAEIVGIAAACGAHVDIRDTTALLDAAFKKGKTAVLRSCLSSMRALNHPVDNKFADSVKTDITLEKLASGRPCNASRNNAPWRTSAAMKPVVAAC